MKVLQITRDRSDKCGHCDRVLRTGQWVLEWLKLDNEGLYTKVRVQTHVECLRKLLADVPWENKKDQFDALRAEMAATGLVFPS